ncbi:MAG: hypothetical protein QM811_05185 [Pirellulales bacterium]
MGNAFHAAPYRNIHSRPSKQCRSSIARCPPFDDTANGGNHGASFDHCSSLNIAT